MVVPNIVVSRRSLLRLHIPIASTVAKIVKSWLLGWRALLARQPGHGSHHFFASWVRAFNNHLLDLDLNLLRRRLSPISFLLSALWKGREYHLYHLCVSFWVFFVYPTFPQRFQSGMFNSQLLENLLSFTKIRILHKIPQTKLPQSIFYK